MLRLPGKFPYKERIAALEQWPPELAEMFRTHMREALDAMDLEKVQELRRFFDKVEQALPAQEQQPFLGKTADVVYDPNPLHTPEHIPDPAMQPLENEVRDPGVIKCACGNVLQPGVEFCPNCGTHKGVMQQNPLEWPIANVKVAELADEPQASQPGMNQPDGQAQPMPSAPNPAAMGDDDPRNKIVQDPSVLARQEIADEAAATNFSQLANLDNADQIVQSLAQAYGLDPGEVQNSLAVQAKFNDVIAINGDISKVDIDKTQFQEVNPSSGEEGIPEDDFSQGIVPPPAPESDHNSLTKVEKAAKVPLQLIINKLIQEQGISEQDANNQLKDNTWGDIPMPMEFDVPVHGELKFFLPMEMVGGQQMTQNPFQTDQRPEDVMDQEYNQVPMQPAH